MQVLVTGDIAVAAVPVLADSAPEFAGVHVVASVVLAVAILAVTAVNTVAGAGEIAVVVKAEFSGNTVAVVIEGFAAVAE